jgi:hypothetical protein
VVVDSRREKAFLRSVFGGLVNEREYVQEVQRSLGVGESAADGHWGPQTRLRFLQRVMEPTRNPVRVSFPNLGPVDLVFDAGPAGEKGT